MRTFLRHGMLGFWPCQEAAGVTKVNALNPGFNDLLDQNGVTQVAGPNASIPFAAGISDSVGNYLVSVGSPGLFANLPFAIACVSQSLPFSLTTNGVVFGVGAVLNPTSAAALAVRKSTVPVGLPVGYVTSSRNRMQTVGFDTGDVWFDGSWHLYCMYYDGKRLFFAIDDSQDYFSIPCVDLDLTGQDFLIGYGEHGNTQYSGGVCNVCAWNRVLTLSDRIDLFNGGLFLPFPV